MNIRHLFAVLLFLPSAAWAGWVLQQSDEGHWVAGQNRDHHQLIISQHGKQKQILLILSLRHKNIITPHSARFVVDQSIGDVYPLELLKRRTDDMALKLLLTDTEQDKLIGQLVAGLRLQIQLDRQMEIDFSLNGFTNTFSDFLIANDVGRLDPLWLQMQGYHKELTCYEIARALVAAMEMRQQGKTENEVQVELSEQMSEEAGSALPDIIDQAYSVSIDSLPRIPSTRKYAFFKRCMKRMK